ncbi:ATP-grasp domain-containing protein [Mycobacterium shigaense]|uniref:ATP-grasp domain-containing protein n=1 Tax=Mycobacterium shigaense TaxID=722731 RepID=A0A1Z4EKG7_9MYCO|nr:ATP-grasp domain-containing protein [Mycobacterium shigaense]MEA1125061.1 ATP-grasp domain-containing protein [Mycobacterium shigaense]BAX93422.1 hypothetical protein MSG_03285 [Mycobacterium shigaense]
MANMVSRKLKISGERWSKPARENMSHTTDLRLKNPDLHVAIFGKHSRDWMVALGPRARLWKGALPVKSVQLLHENSDLSSWNDEKRANTVIIPLLEKHITTLPDGFRHLTSPHDLIAKVSDKKKLHDFLARSGFQEYLPAVFGEGEAVRYPCVVKRLDLYAGDGVRIAHDIEQLVSHLRDPLFRQHPYQIQELIAGEFEYVTHLVCKSGEILEEHSFEYRMRGPAEIRRFRSPVEFNRSTQSDEVMSIFSRIVRSLNFTGPCNVNFKLIDGRPVVFEINPRLGGSLMKKESIEALAKVVRAILDHADQ